MPCHGNGNGDQNLGGPFTDRFGQRFPCFGEDLGDHDELNFGRNQEETRVVGPVVVEALFVPTAMVFERERVASNDRRCILRVVRW